MCVVDCRLVGVYLDLGLIHCDLLMTRTRGAIRMSF